MEYSNICCICLEEIKNNNLFFDCNHNIHQDCVKKWIETNLNKDKYPSCPLCKKDCKYEYLINYIIESKKENNNINYTPLQNYVLNDSVYSLDIIDNINDQDINLDHIEDIISQDRNLNVNNTNGINHESFIFRLYNNFYIPSFIKIPLLYLCIIYVHSYSFKN